MSAPICEVCERDCGDIHKDLKLAKLVRAKMSAPAGDRVFVTRTELSEIDFPEKHIKDEP